MLYNNKLSDFRDKIKKSVLRQKQIWGKVSKSLIHTCNDIFHPYKSYSLAHPKESKTPDL